MQIPYDKLSADALKAVIEEFILREGTDYGQNTYTLEGKVAQVMNQLEKGEIHIEFDPEDESINIAR